MERLHKITFDKNGMITEFGRVTRDCVICGNGRVGEMRRRGGGGAFRDFRDGKIS